MCVRARARVRVFDTEGTAVTCFVHRVKITPQNREREREKERERERELFVLRRVKEGFLPLIAL